MQALFRLPLLSAAALLLASPPFAMAESPLPDPIAPAVVGRPLDQLIPAPAPRRKTAPVKKAGARKAAARPVAAKPPVARQPATKPAAAATAAAAPAPAMQRSDKQASHDRVDPRMQADDLGKGTRLARKELGEGAYFTDPYRIAARNYYEAHPVLRPAVKWKVGEPVPAGSVVALVPRGLLAVLPPAPAGHRYVELGGDVVLVASPSNVVVDGISRGEAETALLAR